MSQKVLVRVLAITVAMVLAMAPAYSADPKLSLGAGGTVTLLPGQESGETHVRLKGENLIPAGGKCTYYPKLEDLGTEGPVKTTVVFETPKKIDQGSSSCSWLWNATVKGLPIHSTQKRSARLSVGEHEQYIDYVLTDLLPAPLGMVIAPSGSPWFAWQGFNESRKPMEILVKTGEFPITKLRVAQAALANNPASTQLGVQDLELCQAPNDMCGTIDVEARTSRTLYLRLKPEAGDHGTFAGIVSFAVNERPELENLNVTVHASSARAKLFGIVCLGLGIFLAWCVNVFAKGRSSRLEALRPVAQLHDSIMALLGELKRAPQIEGVTLQFAKQALEIIDGTLTTEALEKANCLPPNVPNPFSRGTDSSENLKQYLVTQGARIDGMMVMIRDGMRRYWQLWGTASSDLAKAKAIKDALNSLDKFCEGDSRIDRAGAEQKVRSVLDEYQKATAGKDGDKKVEQDAPSAKNLPPTMQALIWKIAHLHGWVWVVWGILSTIGGGAVLILPNMGFGTTLDYIFCLFWGFGLPTTLDKLQQMAPGGIASTIGVSLPKAT